MNTDAGSETSDEAGGRRLEAEGQKPMIILDGLDCYVDKLESLAGVHGTMVLECWAHML